MFILLGSKKKLAVLRVLVRGADDGGEREARGRTDALPEAARKPVGEGPRARSLLADGRGANARAVRWGTAVDYCNCRLGRASA